MTDEAEVIEALEGVGVEVIEPVGVQVERYEAPAGAAMLTVAPAVTAGDLVARVDTIREAMQKAMTKDIDYGVIPGTGGKPTLLKPGAEKLAVLFQLDIQIENEKLWHDDGHLTVISRAYVYHQPTGTRLGSGEGICSTREAKYAYRQGERTCPTCGKPAIIKGKAEYGGGWLCFKKKDGCGAKFQDADERITSQPGGRVANEALADAYNTVDKMASKRARIDAVLAVTGASALFTQDVEDGSDGPGAAGASSAAGAPPAPAASPPSISPEQAEKNFKAVQVLRKKLTEAGLTDEQFRKALANDYGVTSTKDLSAEQVARLRKQLETAVEQVAS